MSRGKTFLTLLFIFTIIFVVGFCIPTVYERRENIISWGSVPFVLLMLYGTQSMFIIGFELFVFNNCKGASEELKGQLAVAKKDLIAKGVLTE